MTQHRVKTFKDGAFVAEDADPVPERPVSIYYNDGEVVTLLSTGEHLEEVAVGFLCSEGVLKGHDSLKSVEVDEENQRVFVTGEHVIDESSGPIRRVLTSGCGKGTVFYEALDEIRKETHRIVSDLRLTPEIITTWMRRLSRGELQEKKTRGMHTCLLVLPDGGYVLREDVGRHNALDKILGRAFLDRLDLAHSMLLTTGRLTSEVVLKVYRLGVPAVLSRSAATDLSVELAEVIDLTLVGYVRGNNFRVYVGGHRIEGLDTESGEGL